ncbi:MAG: hypothetical protein ACKVPJ_08445 [Chitinophagales bacterium]
MLEIPVAILYLCLFLFIIFRKKSFAVDGISNKWFCAAFFYKILFGIGNYLIWLYVIGHGDSLNYFSDSKLIYETLPDNPSHFLQLTFGYKSNSNYPEEVRYVSDFLFYSWNTPEYTMVRINAILNIFTFGSVFGNIILLSFLYFFVHVLLLKTIAKLYPEKTKILFLLFFFLPSLTFWCSGLLKEGPSLLLISLLFIQLSRSESHESISLKNALSVLLLLVFMTITRDFLLLITLPNMLIFYVSKSRKKYAKYIFVSATAAFLALLIFIDMLSQGINIPESLQKIQSYFNIGVTETEYYFPLLPATYFGLLGDIPTVIINILFRPNLFHSTDMFRIYQSIELLFTWGFIFLCLLKINKSLRLTPALLFLLFVSLELLFIYGLVVTDADTLSRYRSIPVFFLLLLACVFYKKRVIPNETRFL